MRDDDKSPPCSCEEPGYCVRFKRRMVGALYEICQGKCPPERPCDEARSKAFRHLWGRQSAGDRSNKPKKVVSAAPSVPCGDCKKSEDAVGEKCLHEYPNVLQLLKNYRDDTAEWNEAGRPIVPEEVRAQRRVICSQCPCADKEQDRCVVCGCPLHETIFGDKLARATSSCPLGKWQATA